MKHKMSILFYTKGTKTSKNGLVPIYLQITVDGTRVEFSTSKFIELPKWNSVANKMKGTSEEARIINSHLDVLKNKVYDIEKFIVQHGVHESVARKIKHENGYQIPVATLTAICFNHGIKLLDFFKALESKYGNKINDDFIEKRK